MLRTAVVLVMIGACSRSNQAHTWSPHPVKLAHPPLDWTEDDEVNAIGQACANIVDSSGHVRCDSLRKAGVVEKDCFGSFERARAHAKIATYRDQLYVRALLLELASATSCIDVDAAFDAAHYIKYAPGSEVAEVDCHKRPNPFGPFQLTESEASRRHGSKATRFSDVKIGIDAPVEVCGVRGEMAWLLRMTCNDGAHPFGADIAKAHATRLSSPPPIRSGCPDGGLVLDKYAVPCAEQTYIVFFDMYECGPSEPF